MAGKGGKRSNETGNEVEKIVDKKTNSKNEVLYKVKWKGFSSSFNTWVPVRNLTKCQDALFEYERNQSAPKTKEVMKQKGKKAEVDTKPSIEKKAPVAKSNAKRQAAPPAATETKAAKRKRTEEPVPRMRTGNIPLALPFMKVRLERMPSGFDKNYEVDKIVGATVISGQLHFMLKWKTNGKKELISNKVAREKIPQLLLNYYEVHIKFNDAR